jgi:hypothetical protein
MATRRRKLGIGCGSVLVLLVGLFFALPTRRIVFPRHYDVVSIASAAEYKDNTRLERARTAPGVSAYPSPPLYQPNGSLCGPTSLANVFQSFGENGTTPTGILEGSGKCWTGMCLPGVTLDELAELAARRPGYRVTVLRNLSVGDFRRHLELVSDPKRRYVINFDRGPLFGKEGGHHSPIGGYLGDEDLVEVLDVNLKYGPWLVKTDRLFAALDTVDGSSGQKRGLLLVEKTN